MMNRPLSVILIFVFLACGGCAASKLDLSLRYGPANDIANAPSPPREGVVGVDEFVDLRPRATTSDAKKWMGFFPGVLWLDIVSEIPDSYTGFFEYRPGPFTVAFPLALYEGIREAGMFREAVFLPRDRYARIDYRIEGVLNRTYLKETGYYYGSSLYAWVTRIAGLPYVSYEFGLDITLGLRRIEDGKVVWTYDIKGTRTDKYYNVYKLTSGVEGRHVLSYNYAKILEAEMPRAMESLRAALGE